LKNQEISLDCLLICLFFYSAVNVKAVFFQKVLSRSVNRMAIKMKSDAKKSWQKNDIFVEIFIT
jgi:hypothetical protein